MTEWRMANTILVFKNEERKNRGVVDPVKLPLISLKILKQMIAVLFASREKMTGR